MFEALVHTLEHHFLDYLNIDPKHGSVTSVWPVERFAQLLQGRETLARQNSSRLAIFDEMITCVLKGKHFHDFIWNADSSFKISFRTFGT